MALVVSVSSCSEKKFHISGEITDAEGQTLYLENVGLDGVEVVDSVKLKEAGNFSFAQKGVSSPEFYRLRLERQVVNLSIDSTEMVVVKASAPTMASQYTVEGSVNCEKIRELALLQMALQAKVNQIVADPMLNLSAVQDSVNHVVDAYKENVLANYIYLEPDKAYAYFALFQTLVVGNIPMLIFNPRAVEADIKAYAAVGTSWDTYHPNSIRGENLHNIAIESMKNNRILQTRASQTIDPEKVDYSGVVDIALKDNQGNVRRLSDLGGKVVLLDFCSFAQEGTTKRIMALRDVYNKFHDRGLEIYQVSLDENEHFWKTQTAALPWVSVNDPQGAASEVLTLYNVQALPTYFLLMRDCTPYKRDAQMEDLEKEINDLL